MPTGTSGTFHIFAKWLLSRLSLSYEGKRSTSERVCLIRSRPRLIDLESDSASTRYYTESVNSHARAQSQGFPERASKAPSASQPVVSIVRILRISRLRNPARSTEEGTPQLCRHRFGLSILDARTQYYTPDSLPRNISSRG